MHTTMRRTFGIILALLLIGLIHPVLADNVVLDEDFIEYEFTGGTRSSTSSGSSSMNTYAVDTIRFADITKHSQVSYIIVEIKNQNKLGSLSEGRTERTYTLGGRQDTAVIYVEHIRNQLGKITSTVFRIFPQNWNNEGLSGQQKMVITPSLASINGYPNSNEWVNDLAWPSNAQFNIIGASDQGYGGGFSIVVSSVKDWQNHLTVESTDNEHSYQINLKREYDSKSHYSTIALKQGGVTVLSDYDHFDFSHITLKSQINSIAISSPATTYTRILGTGSPARANATATVYVQSSQTGALIANADININEYQTDIWYNSTAEWGWTTVDLPVGNYEFYATADGFTQPYPGRLTVDGVDDNIVLLLNPTGPTPAAGNVTLQIWANYGIGTSANRYSVPGAEVSITGVTGEGADFSSGILTCNDYGRVDVEVPGNTTYSMYASAPGYISYSSTFTVTTGTPVHISASLVQGALPTNPTIPATPIITQTPIPEETPGTSFVEQSAAAFATFLGTTYAIGKAALGVIISTAVGYSTAKKLRGGAAEFAIGLLGGAVLTTVIGLLPIQMFVVLFIGVGALLGYQYMGGGGGR